MLQPARNSALMSSPVLDGRSAMLATGTWFSFRDEW
jgi:hypothetical protein